MPPDKTKVAFVGFGEFGSQLFELAKEKFLLDEIVVFDDIYQGEFQRFDFKDYAENNFREFVFIIGVGYKHLRTRQRVLSNLLALNRKVPHLIHPSSFVSNKSSVEPGCYIYPMCNVDKGVSLKTGVVLNNSVVISHDSNIGDSSYLAPGVIISGRVNIGECVFIGSGSVVSNDKAIGDDAIIGLATSVTSDVKSSARVIGNPMKLVERIEIK